MTDITVFPARTIVTMDPSQPTVEAVAVREGKVLAAGSLDECTSWGPHTIDAESITITGQMLACIE